MNMMKDIRKFLPQIVLFVLLTACQANGASGNSGYVYVCPPDFIRLGSSCYYFSTTKETWQNAHFGCKDKESNLTVPERWEDRNLRNHLNNEGFEKHERWIGGMYDYKAKTWKWGGEMRKMNYQSFLRIRHQTPLQWHCVAMIPEYAYRWDARSCIEQKHFICQTRLRKVRKPELEKLRKKWNPNGNGHKPNEISVPEKINIDNRIDNQIDNEIRPNLPERIRPRPNDIPRPRPNKFNRYNRTRINNNPKSYVTDSSMKSDLSDNISFVHKPQATRRNSTRTHNRRKKFFPGYKRDKEDPEAAYLHNVNALRSGKTGLSNAEIEKHLHRLERLRKKDQMRLQREERMREKINREKNFKNDPNDIAQKPSNIRSRKIDENSNKIHDSKENRKGKRGKKGLHSIENVTQKTYYKNNDISGLYPKTIIEIHDFSPV